MPGGEEPLLRPGSPTSNDSAIAEEDALLTGERTGKEDITSTTRSKWREIGLFVWALLATATVVILAVVYQHSQTTGKSAESDSIPTGKRNLIFMVSDGMGPTSLALTRGYRQFTDKLPWDDTLIIDEHMIGQSRTRSSSSLVTDSAAGATAFSYGEKSYNGAISVLPDHTPCGSVMEAAKRLGYTTGLVVTTRIIDATPAVFASHVRRREMEDDVALQMIGETHPLGRMVDLMFGGGRCHFLPKSNEHSCRNDTTDVDIPYEIDRRFQDSTYPPLKSTALKALEALSAATKDTEQGFFIMIEGSRIDHAGHANNPAAQVHEVLAYDETIATVLDFIERTETPTLMVSTSDHETGGLATARQLHPTYPHYLWYPSVLANASHSSAWIAHQYHLYLDALSHNTSASTDETTLKNEKLTFLITLPHSNLGIHDASSDELSTLVSAPAIAAYSFADMVSRRAQTGWSTHGHSGADVNIFASNRDWAKDLAGNHENTEIGEFLRRYLGAEEEVENVTAELREKMDVTHLGEIPQEGERLDGQDHLDHYHGDHRKRCTGCGA
ncbi:vacuolar alkaline phosphatase [Oleoguttula sp. CCFEE 5521]